MRYYGRGPVFNPWASLALAIGLFMLLSFICSFRFMLFITAILLIAYGISSKRY